MFLDWKACVRKKIGPIESNFQLDRNCIISSRNKNLNPTLSTAAELSFAYTLAASFCIMQKYTRIAGYCASSTGCSDHNLKKYQNIFFQNIAVFSAWCDKKF